jgi:hypothetical protein
VPDPPELGRCLGGGFLVARRSSGAHEADQ